MHNTSKSVTLCSLDISISPTKNVQLCYTVCDGLWPSNNLAANTGMPVYMGVHVIFAWPKLYFKVCALIFYMCVGSSQAIKHAKKLWYQYF